MCILRQVFWSFDLQFVNLIAENLVLPRQKAEILIEFFNSGISCCHFWLLIFQFVFCVPVEWYQEVCHSWVFKAFTDKLRDLETFFDKALAGFIDLWSDFFFQDLKPVGCLIVYLRPMHEQLSGCFNRCLIQELWLHLGEISFASVYGGFNRWFKSVMNNCNFLIDFSWQELDGLILIV